MFVVNIHSHHIVNSIFKKPIRKPIRKAIKMFFLSSIFTQSIDCTDLLNLGKSTQLDTFKPSLYTILQSDCCSIVAGITCINSRVTGINWSGFGLKGTINSTAVPSQLQYMNMSSNVLTGSVPKIPLTVISLDLSYNQLGGLLPVLPASIVYFNVNRNQIVSSIPVLPSTLTHLYLTKDRKSVV